MKKYFHSFLKLSLIPLLLLPWVNVFPCTIIAVGKKASADGSVIISHTGCGTDCRIRVVHGQSFKKGAMAPVHWGIQDIHRPLNDFGDLIGQIPQVEKTYSYFHSAYPHMNEHQLAMTNWSIIKEVNETDKENFMVSANYKQFAIDKGWFDPNGSKPFILQDVYAPMAREWATSRLWLFYSTYAPGYSDWPKRSLEDGQMMGYDQYHQYVEPLSIYPTSVKPEQKISVRNVMAFQRSTFEGTIYDKTEDLDWYVPDGKGGMKKSPLATPFPSKDMRELLDINNRRNVARPQGFYGMIAQLRDWLPDPIGGIYWVFLDNAYTSPYVPIYAGTQEIATCYKNFDPTTYNNQSACWAIDFVDNLLYLKWQEAVKDVWEVRNPFEERLFAERDRIDSEARAIYKKDPGKALEYLTKYTQSNMNEVLGLYNNLHDKLIVKYSNCR